MLLNEFLKAHRRVDEQAATIGALSSAMAQQQKAIATLTSQLQKVSDQLALSRPARRVAMSDP